MLNVVDCRNEVTCNNHYRIFFLFAGNFYCEYVSRYSRMLSENSLALSVIVFQGEAYAEFGAESYFEMALGK